MKARSVNEGIDPRFNVQYNSPNLKLQAFLEATIGGTENVAAFRAAVEMGHQAASKHAEALTRPVALKNINLEACKHSPREMEEAVKSRRNALARELGVDLHMRSLDSLLNLGEDLDPDMVKRPSEFMDPHAPDVKAFTGETWQIISQLSEKRQSLFRKGLDWVLNQITGSPKRKQFEANAEAALKIHNAIEFRNCSADQEAEAECRVKCIEIIRSLREEDPAGFK